MSASANIHQEETALPATPVPPNEKSGLRSLVLQNTAANIAGRGLAIAFSTGAAILLARFLGAEKLGEYGAIYAYLALFVWMATFGFEPILVREISREKKRAANLLYAAIALSAVLSIVAVGAAVVLAPVAGYTGQLRTLLILAGVEYALTPLRMPAVMLQIEMRQWYAAAANVVRQGVWLGIIIGLWWAGAPLIYVIIGRVLAAAVESLLLWKYSRRFMTEAGRLLLTDARLVFSHAAPIAFTGVLAMIYMRIDQVMLHKMVSDSVLGQYVAAVKVSELFEALPSALMFTIAPILAVSVTDPERFRNYTDRTFRYFMVLAAGMCVFMTIGAKVIVRVLYGAQFAAAAPLLAVLIWSEIAVFFATVVVNILVAKSNQKLLPIPTIVGAVVNVALNLILIPRYAALGASWATVVSYTLAWTVALFFFRQTRSVTLQGLRFAIPIALVAFAATRIGMLLPNSHVVGLVLACCVFGAGVWMTRSIGWTDINYLAGTVRESLAKVFS